MPRKPTRSRRLSWLSLFTALAAADAEAQIDGCFDDVPGLPSTVGTPFADVILGTSAVEGICGLAGDDIIQGMGGDDYLSGGEGDDSLVGGVYMSGGAGADTLVAWHCLSPQLRGGTGDDFLFACSYADRLFGEEGNDTLLGSYDMQFLEGGAGNDSLYGDGGDDVYDGGPGDDLIISTAVGHNQYLYTFGDGDDVIIDREGENVLKLFEVPASMVSIHPLPNKDLVVLINGSGLILLSEGVLYPIKVEHCQAPIDVPGSTIDLEICGGDLTQPGSTATVRVSNGPWDATAVLLAGTSLNPVPLPGTDSYIAPGGALVAMFFHKYISYNVETPPIAAGVGITLYTQVVTEKGGVLETSNAIEVKL